MSIAEGVEEGDAVDEVLDFEVDEVELLDLTAMTAEDKIDEVVEGSTTIEVELELVLGEAE